MDCIVSGDTLQYRLETRSDRFPPAYSIGDTTVYLFMTHNLFQFLFSTIPNVTWLRLSDANVIWRVVYFQFPIQSAFLLYIAR